MRKYARYGLAGLLAICSFSLALEKLVFALNGLLGMIAITAVTYFLWSYLDDNPSQQPA